MSRRHTRREQLDRARAFVAFLAAHPPKMPARFSHRARKCVVSYAKVAFATGWNSGTKYDHRHGRGK